VFRIHCLNRSSRKETNRSALGLQKGLELDNILRIRNVVFKQLVEMGADFELAAFKLLESAVLALGEARRNRMSRESQEA
jgi:hypothetical protein